jgi:hypothetical protein
VVPLRDFMARVGADVTWPTLDLDDFIGLSIASGPDGKVYQLPDQQFAHLHWFHHDWCTDPDLMAQFPALPQTSGIAIKSGRKVPALVSAKQLRRKQLRSARQLHRIAPVLAVDEQVVTPILPADEGNVIPVVPVRVGIIVRLDPVMQQRRSRTGRVMPQAAPLRCRVIVRVGDAATVVGDIVAQLQLIGFGADYG